MLHIESVHCTWHGQTVPPSPTTPGCHHPKWRGKWGFLSWPALRGLPIAVGKLYLMRTTGHTWHWCVRSTKIWSSGPALYLSVRHGTALPVAVFHSAAHLLGLYGAHHGHIQSCVPFVHPPGINTSASLFCEEQSAVNLRRKTQLQHYANKLSCDWLTLDRSTWKWRE